MIIPAAVRWGKKNKTHTPVDIESFGCTVVDCQYYSELIGQKVMLTGMYLEPLHGFSMKAICEWLALTYPWLAFLTEFDQALLTLLLDGNCPSEKAEKMRLKYRQGGPVGNNPTPAVYTPKGNIFGANGTIKQGLQIFPRAPHVHANGNIPYLAFECCLKTPSSPQGWHAYVHVGGDDHLRQALLRAFNYVDGDPDPMATAYQIGLAEPRLSQWQLVA